MQFDRLERSPARQGKGRARRSRLVAVLVAGATALGTGGVLAMATPATAGQGAAAAHTQEHSKATANSPKASGPHYGVSGQTDLFTITPDGKLQARWKPADGHWKGPITLAKDADPNAKVSTSQHYGVKGQTDVFYGGGEGGLNATYNNGKGWRAKSRIAGIDDICQSGIADAKHYGSRTAETDVFYANGKGELQVAWVSASSNGWHRKHIAGQVAPNNSDVVASRDYVESGPADVFYVGVDARMHSTYSTNGGAWKDIGMSNSGNLAKSSDLAVTDGGLPSGQTGVFYTDKDLNTHVAYNNGFNWHDHSLK